MVIFCMLIWVIMGDALACGMINGFPSRYKVIPHPQRQELLQGEHEEAVEVSLESWSISVSVKVKNFMWHSCKNILPTKLNHLRHHLSTDGVCEGCGKAQESTGHVFCCYRMAREIWTSCNLGHIMISDEEDFTNVFWRVVQDDKIEAHVIKLIMMTNWAIWTHRN